MVFLLLVALAVNAVLHGVIVYRHGVKDNRPAMIFGIANAVLIAGFVLNPLSGLWAMLIVSIVGTVGLVMGYKTIPHKKMIERVILGLNALIILGSAFVLYAVYLH